MVRWFATGTPHRFPSLLSNECSDCGRGESGPGIRETSSNCESSNFQLYRIPLWKSSSAPCNHGSIDRSPTGSWKGVVHMEIYLSPPCVTWSGCRGFSLYVLLFLLQVPYNLILVPLPSTFDPVSLRMPSSLKNPFSFSIRKIIALVFNPLWPIQLLSISWIIIHSLISISNELFVVSMSILNALSYLYWYSTVRTELKVVSVGMQNVCGNSCY